MERPVIRLDFSNINYTEKTFNEGIVDWLKIDALQYGYKLNSNNGRDAFRELILELSKTTKVVVLIDEYDKPITDYLLNPEKRNNHQAILKGLYGVLKPLDQHIHLVFLTGVSKIGKLSLFSDLNHLQDISLNEKYAQVCGYNLETASLMFQTGYLTMIQKTRNLLGTRYQLSYPNEEVRQAFAKSLLLEYNQQPMIGSFGLELQDALLALDWDAFFAIANRVFMGIPYEIFPEKETYVHSLMHLMLVSSGWRVQSQVQNAVGRLDTLLETSTHSIIFEFKIGQGSAKTMQTLAEKALGQIEIGRYSSTATKTLVKVAVVFHSKNKQITNWKIA
jgi:hypothetical protein